MLTLIRDDREGAQVCRFSDLRPGCMYVAKGVREITKLGLLEARAIADAARVTWVVVPTENADPDSADEAWASLSTLGIKLRYGRFLGDK